MPEQLSFLDDVPPDGKPQTKVIPWDPEQGAAKLFFGLRPKPAQALDIQQISASTNSTNGIHGNLRKAEVLHIPLFELRDYVILPMQEVIDAWQLAESVVSPAFDLVLNRGMTFRGNGAYVLLVSEGLERI